MSRSRLALVVVLVASALPVAPAAAWVPKAKTLYETGPSGRYLLDGPWLFRLDKQGRGLGAHFARQTTTAGWRTVKVPNAWNVQDASDAGYIGTVGWYRKDFKLPSASTAYKWLARFESVNYRARVWINGHEVGTNTGAYLPFEVRLGGADLNRKGVNRLVVRVDNRRTPDDLPPAGFSSKNEPTGGWWNYGGLLREVYLRRISHVDFSTVQVLPDLPCRTCAASVLVRTVVRNYDSLAQPVAVAGTYGGKAFSSGTATIAPGDFHVFTHTLTVAKPELWSPQSPHLYAVKLSASVGGAVAQTWQAHSGIRSIKVVNGHLYLNGRPLNWRGFGLHEDSLDKGSALDNADRAKIVASVQDLGGTFIRAHYPLHPELYELADRKGLLVWSEIPMYQMHAQGLAKPAVRRFAVAMLSKNVLTNGNHPSIIVWSIANELGSKPGPAQSSYIRAAVATAHQLDPTRPVGQAIQAVPNGTCQTRYRPLDILGINEYFNWYPGPDGSMADPTLLSGYLDRVRRCYPTQALAVTEVGAEANRDGSADERGTYEFQQAFANWQFAQLDKKTWLSGATWWALQEFRVRPQWSGGNPRPNPPFHQKGLITLTGFKKPAYFDVQRIFKATDQFPTG
jgi:beta-glucuronidase